MDEFVCEKLTEWNLTDYIETFKEHAIDRESFLMLEEPDLNKLFPRFGQKAKFRKNLRELKTEQESGVESPSVVSASTSGIPERENIGKRKLDSRSEPSYHQKKRPCRTKEDLEDVESIMRSVSEKLPDDNGISTFLRDSISELKKNKREMVGVFGRTGAGKSSLINAILDRTDLLPTGKIRACTSVIIKVEANLTDQRYITEIEFITQKEWEDELWSYSSYIGDSAEKTVDQDIKEKLTALFGDDWTNKSLENLKETRRYKDISELIQKPKLLSSIKKLPEELERYTKNPRRHGNKAWYWPVVKCVTIKVPNIDLLQHVTLVDLPGSGDCNKTRNATWKKVVGSCSTVWIVAEMNRAASEAEPWMILESACSLMGNGGECRNIHFICTKFDQLVDLNSADEVSSVTKDAKDEVTEKFMSLEEVEKHFKKDCFGVFTVSSKEYFERSHLHSEKTEIPKLQRFIRSLDDQQGQVFTYVSGAYGILSLIEEARTGNVEQQRKVLEKLSTNLKAGCKKINDTMDSSYKDFEESLTEAVEEAKQSCEERLREIIEKAPYMTLKSTVVKNGVHKPQKEKEINLNKTLSSFLTDKIDKKFRTTFTNDKKDGPFYNAINAFSLGTKELFQEFNNLKLLLNFFQKEEEKLKTELFKNITDRKKNIYNCLTETIEGDMQKCYDMAAKCTGDGALRKMRVTIKNYMDIIKATMFDDAKDTMLDKLEEMMTYVKNALLQTMMRVIDLSLEQDLVSAGLPDITEEFSKVEEYYDELEPR